MQTTPLAQRTVLLCAVLVALCSFVNSVSADTPSHDAFTYQGQLKHNGDPVAGPANLKFRLYNALVEGDQVGLELIADEFDDFDADGRFTIDLAFGKAVFDGTALWLEIEVDGTILTPRQPIMPTPYAVRALNVATVADGALVGTYTNPLTLNNAGNQFTGTFAGSGAGLTSLNASNISSGTLGSSLLSGTYGNALTLSNSSNSFSGTFSGTHIGSGAGLTSLNASNITTGNLNIARMPIGGNWSLSSGLGITGANVGIGDASPAFRLDATRQGDGHVARFRSDDRMHTIIALTNTSTGGRNFSLLSTGTSHAAGAGAFIVRDAQVAADRLIIAPNGNVGISIPSPDYRLDALRVGDGSVARFRSNDPMQTILALANTSAGGRNFSLLSTGSSHAAGAGAFIVHDAQVAADRLIIAPNGNVGIGSASPAFRLDAQRLGDGSVARFRSDDPAQAILALANTSAGGRNFSLLSTGSSHAAGAGAFIVRDVNDATDRLIIAPNGNIGIGTLSPLSSLHLAKSAQIGPSAFGNVALTIDLPVDYGIALLQGNGIKPGGGPWASLSDVRLKKKIHTIEGALNTLLALRGTTYEFIDPTAIGELEGVQTGFIAQEVEQIMPDWVSEFNGHKALSIRGFEALVVEALRELRAEKDAEIASLQQRIERLEAIIMQLGAHGEVR